MSLFGEPQRPQSKLPLSSTRGASRVRGCRSLLGSSAFADALLSGNKLLYGSRTLLGSRLLGGFFRVRSVLSGSCLALLGSGSLLDGRLLRGLFDCLATRRCCVAGLTLLSFRGGNLYITRSFLLARGCQKEGNFKHGREYISISIIHKRSCQYRLRHGKLGYSKPGWKESSLTSHHSVPPTSGSPGSSITLVATRVA